MSSLYPTAATVPTRKIPSLWNGPVWYVTAQFTGKRRKGRIAERNAMMASTHALSISRQAQLAGISRGSVYDVPKSVGAADLGLMRCLDALHLEHPFMGARLLRDQLNREGYTVGRTHVGTLMARMGMEALYRQPSTRKKAPWA